MISRKNKRNPIYMEVRKILLGQIEKMEDGAITSKLERSFQALGSDGSQKVRLWGLTSRTDGYRSKANQKKTMQNARDAMLNIGRRVHLRENEEAEACLMKTYVFYPVVLVFAHGQGGEFWLSAYSARALTSRLAIRIAVKQFEKSVPESLQREVQESRLQKIGSAFGKWKTRKKVGRKNENE